MKTQAAVLVQTGRPLELMDLKVPSLKPGQVLVELAYSGVCHTQLLEVRGLRGEDKFLPHCLGHEGTGKVLEIGEGVTRVQPEDRVVLSWIKGEGSDVPGSVFEAAGTRVNAGAVTTFNTHGVISENRLTVLPDAIGMREGAMIGCAVPTGLGVVFNTLQARPGESIAVFGAGGVGLCAVIGAHVAGCAPIIAIDQYDWKLDLAKELGATHTLKTDSELDSRLREISQGSLDLAAEATGVPAVMRTAFESVRPQGGRAAILGNAPFGREAAFNPLHFNMGKRLLGSWGGECHPDRDFPRFFNLMESGRLSVDPMMSRDYTLEQVNSALEELEDGKLSRPMIALATDL